MRCFSRLAASTCRGPHLGGLGTPTWTRPSWSPSPRMGAPHHNSPCSAASVEAPTSWRSAPPSHAHRVSTASTAAHSSGSGGADASLAATSWRSATVGNALVARPTGNSPSGRASSGQRRPTGHAPAVLEAVLGPTTGHSRHLRPSVRGGGLPEPTPRDPSFWVALRLRLCLSPAGLELPVAPLPPWQLPLICVQAAPFAGLVRHACWLACTDSPACAALPSDTSCER